MKDVKLIRSAKLRKESRDIASKILDFGVKEEQKIDIMFNLAITLENNTAMKEIVETLKKFRESINTQEEDDNNSTKSNKILV
tara:strand:+ start:1176 stop:1424 length:249 start_codon:yes stop_codon:yes gene_type:complete